MTKSSSPSTSRQRCRWFGSDNTNSGDERKRGGSYVVRIVAKWTIGNDLRLLRLCLLCYDGGDGDIGGWKRSGRYRCLLRVCKLEGGYIWQFRVLRGNKVREISVREKEKKKKTWGGERRERERDVREIGGHGGEERRGRERED
ncbi:hypothetical protein RIF29_15740 [Crotalaria pallida]|uniref:Uncharacterized protein n=1 Tax=Crotalaria pallida TaxID=3830 RepID=A0AAN9IDU5_CROPI